MATVSLLANGLGDVNRGGSLMPTGTVLAFAGSTAPSGWLLCDGTAYLQSDYPALFGVIASTYNTQTNPTTGASYTTSAGQFRVPDYRGCFLRSSGQASGLPVVTVGGFQNQATAKNGLTNSSSSVSASGSTSTDGNHQHGIDLRNSGGGLGYPATTNNGDATDLNTGFAGSHSHSVSVSGTAAAQTITGDVETRPINKGVMYIIKV